MEKTKLIKIFLVITVAFALIISATTVFADDTAVDFSTISNTSSNSTSSNTNSNTNSTNTNTNTSFNTNSSNTNSISSNTANIVSNTNSNSSSYNTNINKTNTNTNLPKTGLAETGSTVCIVFALVVSALFAFKKLRDYNV